MDKVLTISVAAYNVAAFIRNTLDSLVVKEIMDDLEVFVVDDGGTDETLSIAREYEKQYPDTFHAVHKENGGYGSTVNYSLAHATGKYFKLLDGDDWYQSQGLCELVKIMKASDADVIVTNYLEGPGEGRMHIYDYFAKEGPGVKPLAGFVPKEHFGMWPMAVKTEVMRASGIVFPEKMLYTDQFMCTIPFAVARTIEFVNVNVYCYRTERDGQSMSVSSRIKHYKEAVSHCVTLTKFCAKCQGNPNYPFIVRRVGAYHCGAINTMMLKPINLANLREIKAHEKMIRGISEDVYQAAVMAGRTGKLIAMCRKLGYLPYWLLPIWKKLNGQAG